MGQIVNDQIILGLNTKAIRYFFFKIVSHKILRKNHEKLILEIKTYQNNLFFRVSHVKHENKNYSS